MKTENFPTKQNSRRKAAKERLEAQLKSGVKNTKDGEKPLDVFDVRRIEKEIRILNERITR